MIVVLLAALLAAVQEPLPENAAVRLAGHSDGVRSVAWSPDARFLLTGSRDRTLALWDASTGERVRVMEGHDGGVTSVAFSPDGALALSGSQDKSVILWEVASGKLLRRMKGHTQWVTCVAFAPDGRRALSGSLDRTAILWDTTDGSQILPLAGHGDRVLAVAFSPDGKQALTASADRSVQLWKPKRGRAGAVRRRRRRHLRGLHPRGRPRARRHLERPGPALGPGGQGGDEDLQGPCRQRAGAVPESRRPHVRLRRPGRLRHHRRRRDGPEAEAVLRPSGAGMVGRLESGRAAGSRPAPKTAPRWSGALAARARERDEWARTWKAMAPEAPDDRLESPVSPRSRMPDAAALAETREWLLMAGEEIVGAMLDTFSPTLTGAEPPAEQLRKILADLDSETFAVPGSGAQGPDRPRTRRACRGSSGSLKDDPPVSVEVRASLEDVRPHAPLDGTRRASWTTAAAARSGSCWSCRGAPK
jgi:hypothetical protein